MRAADMLAGGARLVRAQPRAIAIWAVLYLVLAGLMVLLAWPALGNMVALQQQAAAAQAAGLPPAPLPPESFGRLVGAVLLLDIVLLLVLVVLFAAAVRATALGGHDRFAFLRLGMDELRLVGLAFILMLGWVALAIAGVLVLVVIGLVVALIFGQQSPALLVIVPAYFVLYLVALWALVRLSLSGALTVLRGRIVLRDAWRLTRGRFWTLFGVFLLIWLAVMAVAMVTLALTNPSVLSFYANGMQPRDGAAMMAQQQALVASLFGPRMIVTMLVGALFNTVVFAFASGAVATAAIGLDAAANAGSAETAPDRT